MSTRARFRELVAQPSVPLGAACFALAEHLGHPTSSDVGLQALDQLGVEVGDLLGSGRGAADLDGVARHLFATLGFRGDRTTYYDARNSMLPDVLRRRVGIPITLSIVTIEVAARVGVAASGVGMPGHFLVGDGSRPQRWLDAFDGGTWLDERGARRLFSRLHGAAATFDPAFLRPTPGSQVVARVLANLAAVHRNAGDPTALLRCLELRSDIPGAAQGPRDRVELAEAYVGVGRTEDALEVLAELHDRIDPRRRAALEARMAQLRTTRN